MSIVEKKLILTGSREGRTVQLGGYQFVNGYTVIRTDSKNVDGLIKYFGRSYKAFEEGSLELKHYQELDRQRKEGISGTGQAHAAPRAGQPVPSGVQPGGGKPQEVPQRDGSAADDSPARPTGSLPSGDGHPDSGDLGTSEEQNRILKAVNSLDPANDGHWTTEGHPRVDVVAERSGLAQVSRAAIEAAAPGVTRPKR